MFVVHNLGVVENCHHFHERTQRTLGGRVSRVAVRFLKMSFIAHCDFEGYKNKRFQSTLLVGREGVAKKGTVSV